LLAWIAKRTSRRALRAPSPVDGQGLHPFRLTGIAAMEETDMSATSLKTCLKGPTNDRLLAWFGIPDVKRLLPPLVKSPKSAAP
jgi:hypothetical protein